jgi:hypothetical protein
MEWNWTSLVGQMRCMYVPTMMMVGLTVWPRCCQLPVLICWRRFFLSFGRVQHFHAMKLLGSCLGFMVGSDELIKSHVSQSSAARAPDLMRQVIRTAKLLGANTLIPVSPIGMEKLLRENGYQVKRADRPQVYMGSSIVALQIELDCQNTLAASRNNVKIKNERNKSGGRVF